MAVGQLRTVIHQLRRLAYQEGAGALTDAELLERFVSHHDQAAFELLAWRHGGMVLGVCRRVLRHEQDAEDAFQATFLAFVRQAGSIGKGASVGSWLYQVARRAALRARAAAAARARHERGAVARQVADPGQEAAWREVGPVLEQEIGRLPEKYRVPVVLCHLEGMTLEQAARQLGCPPGTVGTRVRRARERLRRALARRGLALPAGAVLALMPDRAAPAGVPAALMGSTMNAAARVAAGQAVTSGLVSPRVAALTEGVIKAMFPNRFKLVVAVLLAAVALGGFGVSALVRSAHARGEAPKAEPAARPPAPAKPKAPAPARAGGIRTYIESQPWVLTKMEAEKRTISFALPQYLRSLEVDYQEPGLPIIFRPYQRIALDEVPVARDAKVFIDGKKGTLADLEDKMPKYHDGMRVSLRLGADGATVTRIDATSSPEDAILKATDVEKNTVTVEMQGKVVTLPLRFDAKVYVGRGEHIEKEGEFTDLKPGMQVALKLGVAKGKVVVKAIKAWKWE
jgi:RNA polymerase sigma factor (sigma-70 family)